ncbi:unnamed protein product [Closterium sp. Naga37s-1]|nr:unnamed protein product [Closterium sp. Naga37s-1]
MDGVHHLVDDYDIEKVASAPQLSADDVAAGDLSLDCNRFLIGQSMFNDRASDHEEGITWLRSAMRILWVARERRAEAAAVERPNTKQYIVHLSSVRSVLSYRGGVNGLRATATVDDEEDDAIRSTPAAVLTVQQLSARAARIMRTTPWGRLTRPDVRLPHVQAFTRFLEASHRSLLQSLKIPSSAIFHSYTYLMNRFAAQLTASEARRLKLHPAVAEVERDQIVEVASVHSPEFLKLDSSLWPANGGQSNAGEGVIIGVIDSGIWPEHPSFSDPDTSGVAYSTAPVRWRGVCTKTDDFTTCSQKVVGARNFLKGVDWPAEHLRTISSLLFPDARTSPSLLLFPQDTSGVSYSTAPVRWRGVCSTTDDFTVCSRKVVGARYFLKGVERAFGQVNTIDNYRSPRDMQQHGTWCAGAAAGNAGVEVTVGGRTFGTASGMAPRARLAIYKALWMMYGVKGKGATSDLIAAAEKAVADGVDVISCSWGGLALYFQDLPYLRGLKAGVVTAFAAGNKGQPKRMNMQGTLSSASPFYLTVGARYRWSGKEEEHYGEGVHGGADSGQWNHFPLHLPIHPHRAPPLPTAPHRSTMGRDYTAVLTLGNGTTFTGRSFGGTAATAAPLPLVLAGDYTTVGLPDDPHSHAFCFQRLLLHLSLPPPFHLPFFPIPSPSCQCSPTATLSAFTVSYATNAPQVAYFSSTGPPRSPLYPPALLIRDYPTNDILKPDVVGPGFQLWAAGPGKSAATAATDPPEFGYKSGTSMSTAHLAGIMALIVQNKPSCREREEKGGGGWDGVGAVHGAADARAEGSRAHGAHRTAGQQGARGAQDNRARVARSAAGRAGRAGQQGSRTAGRARRRGLQGARGAQDSRARVARRAAGRAGCAGQQDSRARRAAGRAGRTGQQGSRARGAQQGCRAHGAHRAAGQQGAQGCRAAGRAGRAGRTGLQGARGAQGCRARGARRTAGHAWRAAQGAQGSRTAGRAGRAGLQGARGAQGSRAAGRAGRTGLQIPSPPLLHPQQGDGGEGGGGGGRWGAGAADPLPPPCCTRSRGMEEKGGGWGGLVLQIPSEEKNSTTVVS